ncbi:MAG: NUDIX hydrolase [Chlamydiales bacterium]|nr:NUDIX hydrolase [Chlamydiales bacterium]
MADVYEIHPIDFEASLDVSACYCEWQGQFLFLKRCERKSQGGLWCVPAGKREKEESVIETALRELHEETGIIATKNLLSPIRILYVELPHVCFNYHMYHLVIPAKPTIVLDHDEHVDSCWLSLEEASRLPLVVGEKESLKFVTPRHR